MGLNDTATRLIRTWVPLVIGGLVANIPALADVFNTDALVVAAIGGYYLLAAMLEKLHPAFGYMLGTPK